MNTASSSGTGSLSSNTVANPKGQLKAITTRSGLALDGPTVPMPPPFINSEEDERVEETFTNPEHGEFTIKLHINITLADALILIPKYQKMLKSLLSNKEKLIELANTPVSENCSAVILKKLPEKLGDPGKFLIPCGFNELKCKALADLGIARDVFVPIGKFTFPADFVIVDYESDPRNDDLPFDAESDLLELEYLLNHDPIKVMDSILEDSVDENSLDDNINDYISEMFTMDHAITLIIPHHFGMIMMFSTEVFSEELRLCLRQQRGTRCQKPGHLAARLGCAETKVATWDNLAFKLIILGWNVKHGIFAKR
ncbi:hypothetical protein Tco_0179157 [Tanacetum coccineum]